MIESVLAKAFELLASDPTPQHVKWAKLIHKEALEHDHNDQELNCDKALLTLGLAKLCTKCKKGVIYDHEIRAKQKMCGECE